MARRTIEQRVRLVANTAEIHNLAIRHLDEPELAHAIESAKEGYRQQRRGLSISINIDGKAISDWKRPSTGPRSRGRP
jgi:hypothetical protein